MFSFGRKCKNGKLLLYSYPGSYQVMQRDIDIHKMEECASITGSKAPETLLINWC